MSIVENASVPATHDVDRHALLERTWGDPPGILGWFMTVNHKRVGKRFMVTAFIFFLLGGLLAVLMRLQLSRPENHFLGPDKYNQIFTMHGSTMMFLFAVPMMFEAFSVYLVPLMVGARNIAFPRLNAFSYYIYVFGGIMLWVAFIYNTGPDVGWFAYPPLSGPAFTPGKRADFWAQMITFTELSALAVAVETTVTMLKMRAPGMSLNRLPMFCWSEAVTSLMVIFAMPAVMLASTMLLMDRMIATHFFNPSEGGDALLYQHMFWFFGHPEVYIIFIPGTGIVSTIIGAFSRRKVFGYTALVLSTVATGFIGFGVWVHHMFATGLPQMADSFFTAASLMIVVPTGVQFFCWIATLWSGRLHFELPMWWIGGFFFVFLIGGLTGLMLAAVPLDWQIHDTYFVVAHLHYVLIGGAVFPLFGAFYYWFPKITGRMLGEALGKIHFWLFFIGFNLTFFPMYILGLRGMPRRIYTYPLEMQWGRVNALESLGALLMGLGVLAFIWNVFQSNRFGRIAGNDPWGAGSLEWATTSPPPNYNFLDLPTVGGREPLWENAPDQPVVTGVREDMREVLSTKPLDAEPDHLTLFPYPTIWPFLAALAVTGLFLGSIFTPWAVVWGAIPVAITLTGWFWPTKKETAMKREIEVWENR